ncbi:MAG: GGDEF domain-containing protein [Candidatus Aureabacteria bacterium]|nr:GGDEF domain-containing protein [Candidatus Auribacterota bacterium]MCK5160652.1 GGDEF domain-containing protein [Candidatus Auribacterota bacterium]
MAENLLLDIISLCLSIDRKSYKIYEKLSKVEKDNNLRDFWKEMSLGEKFPVEYWREMLYFAEKGMIPQVFDDPVKVKDELETIDAESNLLLKECENMVGHTNSFLLAYSLEFYLLHPAFVLLFHFMRTLPEESKPKDDYENHIQKVIDALKKYGMVTSELELLGKTIKRLWHDSKLLTMQTTIDTLTNVLNRRGLFNAINLLSTLAKRHRYNIGIMMMDIDHFKEINDTYGHQKGDKVLQQVAGLIKRNIRSSDVIGRYGGEEFLIFLAPVDVGFLKKIAEKICKLVETGTKGDLPVTISIGVAKGVIETDVKKELDTLIKKSDEALYKAKSTGRNRVIICD